MKTFKVTYRNVDAPGITHEFWVQAEDLMTATQEAVDFIDGFEEMEVASVETVQGVTY